MTTFANRLAPDRLLHRPGAALPLLAAAVGHAVVLLLWPSFLTIGLLGLGKRTLAYRAGLGMLILGFAAPYRVSWATSAGGLGFVKDSSGEWQLAPVCTDNDSNWSGGHVSMALEEVAGVFFSNRKLQNPGETVAE